MRAILCASLCNCRHSLKADSDEGLVEAALEHIKLHHPAAPVEAESIRKIISERAYDIEYLVVYSGGYGPEAEFGVERY